MPVFSPDNPLFLNASFFDLRPFGHTTKLFKAGHKGTCLVSGVVGEVATSTQWNYGRVREHSEFQLEKMTTFNRQIMEKESQNYYEFTTVRRF